MGFNLTEAIRNSPFANAVRNLQSRGGQYNVKAETPRNSFNSWREDNGLQPDNPFNKDAQDTFKEDTKKYVEQTAPEDKQDEFKENMRVSDIYQEPHQYYGVTDIEKATGIPAISDYNGFNFQDWGGPHNSTGIDRNGVGAFNKEFIGDNPANYAEQAAALGDDEYDAWQKYLANTDLGTKYSSTADFQLNGTADEWRDAILSDQLSGYYNDIFNQFGGSKDAFDFDSFWNTYKPRELENILSDNAMVQDLLGTSAGLIDNFSNYLVNNLGIYTENADSIFRDDDEANKDIATALSSYELGDRILQNMLANGITGDDFLSQFNTNELNQIFRADKNYYSLDSNDMDGLLNDWGKNNPDLYYHSTDFNLPAFQQYGGIPYVGLADTLTALAGDKLYHKERSDDQGQ